jgi:hypothetical protein
MHSTHIFPLAGPIDPTCSLGCGLRRSEALQQQDATKKRAAKKPASIEDRISSALPIGWTESDYLALAMAALDQGGVSAKSQAKIAELVGICVDCRLATAEYSDRCEPCCELHDADRLKLARDIEIDRRIDERRGK